MKKKKIITLLIVCALVVILCIPQVNALAMNALAGFRVGQAKTITITLDDITQMVSYAQENAETYQDGELPDGWEDYVLEEEGDSEDAGHQEILEIDSISDFTAFDVKLPGDLENEQVNLYAADQVEKTFTLEDGNEVSVALSPTLIAAYEDTNVLFAATQGMSDSLTDEQKADLHEKILSLPFLTENIRSQLADIDPSTKDIYLPVITGISREADINGTAGYLYGMNELHGIAGALPEGFAEQLDEADTEEVENINLLIWTKDGVLYMLCGDMPETELTAIARSVR